MNIRLLGLISILLVMGFPALLAQGGHAVETAIDPDLGIYLIDEQGMTLYFFEQDTADAACL